MTRRNFTVEEANGLLPHLERVIRQIQELRGLVTERADKIKVLDVIWGRSVADTDNPDHDEFQRHRRAIGSSVREVERLIREEILGLGVRFPPGGLEQGLLDFPTVLDGRWVYLCWRLGEAELEAWHELDAGFAGRNPLTQEIAERMGRSEPTDTPPGLGL